MDALRWMAVMLVAACACGAGEGPKVGDTLPDLTSKDENGKEWKLSTLKGKGVVFFFYPRADTPG